MVRECVAPLLLLPVAGCSLLLDFSDGAIPTDGSIDAPYSQAECDYKEPNNSLATAASITEADTGPAAICAGAPEDHDFYRFTVPASATQIDIRIAYTFRAGGDLDLRLYDQTGAVLAQSVGFGDEERITCPGRAPACPMLAAGDYVFEVLPAPGSVNRYTIALAIAP
jgi:hypothetical protein